MQDYRSKNKLSYNLYKNQPILAIFLIKNGNYLESRCLTGLLSKRNIKIFKLLRKLPQETFPTLKKKKIAAKFAR